MTLVHSLSVLLCAGVLLLAQGCEDHQRSTTSAPAIEDPVPSKPRTPERKIPAFEVAPAYQEGLSDGSVENALTYAFNEPMAIGDPQTDDDGKPIRIPPQFRKKMPVLLDLSESTETMNPMHFSQVANVQVYASDRKTRLAVFVVGRDCCSSRTIKSQLWTDIGHVTTFTIHLRMALPERIFRPLFSEPSRELVILGLDADGRTVAVQTINGHASQDCLYVDDRVVSYARDAQYDDSVKISDWSFDGTLAFDEAPAKPLKSDARIRFNGPPQQNKVSPMVLDLSCTMPHGEGNPIRAIDTVYIFDADSKLLKTFDAKRDGVYSRGTDTNLRDETYAYEHLRIGLTAGLAQRLRADSTVTLHIIALDAKGRTVTAEYPQCIP